MLFLIAVLIFLVLFALHLRKPLPTLAWMMIVAALLMLSVSGALGAVVMTVAWIVLLPLGALWMVQRWRMRFLSEPLLRRIRRTLPAVSATEREAIEAGTVWWDAELFQGAPNWDTLLQTPPATLTDEEQAYLDGPVERLCEMLDDWDITHVRNDLPPEVWAYLKEHRFFALNIPKRYGGLEFSPAANSAVVLKVCSRSGSAGATVMVPNSLGPAELLMHYGTEEQKDYYLPRLAAGDEVPCFALTGPWAGSDAGAMMDAGALCERVGEDGKRTLGFVVSWSKRYITLGPVATVIGLAFRAYDPEGLLGGERELGITCALVPADTPGVSIGRRHLPLNAAFMNGPNYGDQVFVPLERVIGGRDGVGRGWRMLMESLAAGRAISLPASGVAVAKLACRTSGAYARVRRQFNLPIGRFEGVEEALARIGGLSWLMDATRRMTLAALLQGEKPSVISAIVKQQLTEGARQAINDAMDIHGGRGICMGPANYLAHAYQQLPIAITVEGANILTRSMIVFGQGAMRCHPCLLQEIEIAAGGEDDDEALQRFDQLLMEHLSYVFANLGRAWGHGLSDGRLALPPAAAGGDERRHYQRATRLSAAFSVLADVSLLLLGGALKRREKLSGRFADALSGLYLCSAALKQHHDDGRPPEDRALLDWGCRYSLWQTENAMREILRNFPSRAVAVVLRVLLFPLGFRAAPPGDHLGHAIAQLMMTPGAARERLNAGAWSSDDPEDVVGCLEHALAKVIEAEPLERRLHSAGHTQPPYTQHRDWVAELLRDGTVNESEARLLEETRAACFKAISVDEFDEP